MKVFLLVVVSFAQLAFATVLPQSKSLTSNADPEASMRTDELIRYWGYPVESHEAVTEDGYQLTVFRIPRGKNQKSDQATSRPVVFLQHGLDGSSAHWVTNLPNQSAGFLLADAGFDVWLGNFRGNMHGKSHKSLRPKEHAFWEFSVDEMARYDLPATVHKALEISKVEKLYYVGFSLGSMTALAKLSQDEEFSKKIKKFYALSPMADMTTADGPVRFLTLFVKDQSFALEHFNSDEFTPDNWTMLVLQGYFCDYPPSKLLCNDPMFLILGVNSTQLNITRIPVYLKNTLSGASTRTFLHLGQMIDSEKFQMYDFINEADNQKHYGQPKPPAYDLRKVDVPVVLYSSDRDYLADAKDVATLKKQLKNVVDQNASKQLSEFFNLDFIWGTRAAAEIYTPIAEDVRRDFSKDQFKSKF